MALGTVSWSEKVRLDFSECGCRRTIVCVYEDREGSGHKASQERDNPYHRCEEWDHDAPVPPAMSFFALEKEVVQASDHVIVYISPEDLTLIQVEAGSSLQNRLGRFKHDEMIGRPFGSQVWSHDHKKQLHILRPTPELWTRALPHRTQIIYMPDIAFILEMLEVSRGSIVIESGTGSGSFSHSFARAVGETGHLYTFDFHEERAKQAAAEFTQHGLAPTVTAGCRDVCSLGFGLANCADAVFLDLPSPWLAVSHAQAALRKDRPTRIACFSPCMEQVQRTLPALVACGFCELEMFEVVLRPLEVEEVALVPISPDGGGAGVGQKRRPESSQFFAKYQSDIKGHTSYLYFATLLPLDGA